MSEFDSGYEVPSLRTAEDESRGKLGNVIFEEMEKQRLEHQVEYAALEPDYPALREGSEEHN